MVYNKQNVFTAVTAEDISERIIVKGVYGYFAHDIDSLKKALKEDKTNRRCMYGRLTAIKDETNRARFVIDKGDYIFSLFYPTDSFLNTERY